MLSEKGVDPRPPRDDTRAVDTLVGANVDRGVYVITERLRGEPVRGLYRARRATGPGTTLVSIGLPQRRPLAEVAASLRIGGGRVAPMRFCGPVDVPRVGRCDAIVEDEPAGRPLDVEAPGAVDVKVAAEVGIELARAAEEAHRAGTVLGGVRPELIYVARVRDRLILTGLAPRCERFHAGATASPRGVVPCFADVYLAPEVLGRGEPRAASDVFSICAVIARLVGGEYPFEGDSLYAKAEAILASRRRRLAGPMALVGLLAHGLALNPGDRLGATELAAELARLA